MSSFEGRNALIIGASRGIGKSIAQELAKQNANLILFGRSENSLAELNNELSQITNSHYFVGDAKNEADINKLIQFSIEKLGGIDILIHNAAIFPQSHLESLSLQEWQDVINVNLTAVYLTSKACTPHLKKSKHPAIVIISSITGPQVGYPGMTHYAASKAGITGFIKSAALDLSQYNIRINAIEPGNICTDGYERFSEDEIQNMANKIPLQRLGWPSEIAKATLFLASDDASYITGTSLVVDGGQILQQAVSL